MITRRNLALLAGAPLLSGLPARAQGTPRRGGELIFGLDGAAVSSFVLDPHNSGFAPHNRVFRSIFDSLTVLLPDQSVGPWLATAWEIAEDGRTYTFRLRTDVTFHDGTRFDAAAVKANLDRIADRRNALTALPDIGPYAGSEVLAPDTVRVELREPFTPLLRNLSKTTLGIVSPTALQRLGNGIASNPVGSGPFRIVSVEQGVEVVLARNESYAWAPPTAAHQGPAHLDRLVFKNVPEESTRVAALQSRQVHAVDAVPPQHVVGLRGAAGFRLIEKELLNNNYTLYLNVAKAPWDDEEVRRAFRLSLDVDALVRVIYLGTQPRAWAPLSPSLYASADRTLAQSWQPNPAEAARILDAKGWKPGARGIREKDGRRLTVSFADTQGNREKRLDVIQLARRQLQRSGFDLSIDSQPDGTYREKLANGDYDLAGASQFAPDPDVLRRLHLPDGRARSSVSKVDDTEISAWLRAGTREPDGPNRIALYGDVQRRLVEKVYAIPVYVLLYNIATTDKVSGIAIDAHGFPAFHGAWLAA
ncbi:MAG: ABC transporter substrate-binding protein [Azospirillum brasilense]|nr:MAG: ABC transporter substrate-binding protein [Azospirillum brasilense]